jgi:hypothetical protein
MTNDEIHVEFLAPPNLEARDISEGKILEPIPVPPSYSVSHCAKILKPKTHGLMIGDKVEIRIHSFPPVTPLGPQGNW